MQAQARICPGRDCHKADLKDRIESLRDERDTLKDCLLQAQNAAQSMGAELDAAMVELHGREAGFWGRSAARLTTKLTAAEAEVEGLETNLREAWAVANNQTLICRAAEARCRELEAELSDTEVDAKEEFMLRTSAESERDEANRLLISATESALLVGERAARFESERDEVIALLDQELGRGEKE